MKDTHILFQAAGLLCIFLAVCMMFQTYRDNQQQQMYYYQQQQYEDSNRRIRVWPFVDIETRGDHSMYRKGYRDGFYGYGRSHWFDSDYNRGYARGCEARDYRRGNYRRCR